jgi:hypothetical protein
MMNHGAGKPEPHAASTVAHAACVGGLRPAYMVSAIRATLASILRYPGYACSSN